MAYPVRAHQLGHVHFVRRLVTWLQEEGGRLLASVRGPLSPRRNSVEVRPLRRERWAIPDRLRSTRTERERILQRLEGGSCPRAARAIRREAKARVGFAEVAVHGVRMPVPSDGVERARWGRGLRDHFGMLPARKTRRGVYDLAAQRYWGRGAHGRPLLSEASSTRFFPDAESPDSTARAADVFCRTSSPLTGSDSPDDSQARGDRNDPDAWPFPLFRQETRIGRHRPRSIEDPAGRA